MPAGNQPTATVTAPAGSTVTVSWAASVGGAPVAGYEVRSYDATTGIPRAVGASCAGIIAATSCSETNVPDGSWRFSVVPRQQAWAGAESPLSNAVIVDTSYRALILSDSPGAFWRLGESSGTTAVDELGASHGTYTGGYTLGAAGAVAGDPNTATALNGSTGRVIVPAAATALNITGNLSVEAWIRPGATQLANARVLARYNGVVVQYLLAYDSTARRMRFVLDVASGRITALSAGELRDGLWHHIVGTWDGTTARLYVDGVLQPTTASGTGPVQVANTTTVIGSDSANSAHYAGLVDEAAVYPSALAPAQILAHYQKGSQNRPTVTLTFPGTGPYSAASWNAGCSSRICGTATDPDGSVASMAVSVRRSSTGTYWNGTAFASASPVLLPATGTTNWSLAFPDANFPADGAYIVTAVATDSDGNDGGVTASFSLDRTGPTVAFTFPAAGGTYANTSWNAGCTSRICGTAADPGSGVSSVAVSVRQGTGNYWNGSSFGSASEVLFTATGTTSWNRAFPATNFPADGSYTVRAVATDLVGNTTTTSRTFTIDRTSPAPTALALVDADGLVTTGTDEVRITFSEPLSVSSVCSAWSGSGDQSLGGSAVVVTITDAGANDVLTVAAGACTLHVGSVATGGDYVLLTSTFSGSTAATESRVTWTAATRVLTIHIGSQASGLLNLLAQAAATATYTPDAAITDLAGNGVVSAPFNAATQRF